MAPQFCRRTKDAWPPFIASKGLWHIPPSYRRRSDKTANRLLSCATSSHWHHCHVTLSYCHVICHLSSADITATSPCRTQDPSMMSCWRHHRKGANGENRVKECLNQETEAVFDARLARSANHASLRKITQNGGLPIARLLEEPKNLEEATLETENSKKIQEAEGFKIWLRKFYQKVKYAYREQDNNAVTQRSIRAAGPKNAN